MAARTMATRLATTVAALAALCCPLAARATRPDARLSVLTYNVHGLPWPFASGRSAAMAAIAARLRRMRSAGVQPDVVALQEAFGDDAKAIGRAAGYRYAAFGPDVDLPSAPSPADRAFERRGSILRGEGVGKHLDSGLAIFSDYPILAVRRLAYSTCAGYDCLANKGALATLIAVPGQGPVTIIDTHLNAARASGVTPERHRRAYVRQVRQLAAFEESLARPGSVVLLAGDFNVGHDPVRNAAFRLSLVAGRLPSTIAATVCGGCRVAQREDVRTSLRRRKDWLLYRAPNGAGVRPFAFSAPFGRLANGTMLSDHVGVMVRYRLSRTAAGTGLAALR